MTQSPHDALFKTAFSQPEHARAELESLLPAALVARIDWATLTLVPGSFIDESLTERESDLLFEARTVGGVRVRLYLLFEHQSTVDVFMPFRMLRYEVRIWERDRAAEPLSRTMVPVVPVVLHHSEAGWTAATSFEALFDLGDLAGTGIEAHLPRFSFVLDDISRQSDEQIAERLTSAVVRLTLATLREARRSGDSVRALRRLAQLCRDVVAAPGGRAALGWVLRYLLTVAASDDPRPFFDALAQEVGPEGKDTAMGLLDTLVERGRNEGRQDGVRSVLTRQLELKFGALPERTLARLARMDAVAVERALERVLTATRLEDVVPTT